MARKRKAQELSPEAVSSPSDANEEEEQEEDVSTSGSSDPGSDSGSEVEDSPLSSPSSQIMNSRLNKIFQYPRLSVTLPASKATAIPESLVNVLREMGCKRFDVVDVDFEFFDPKPDDFHGTKALLRKYLDDVVWDINGFVELFLAQTTVGSVVKTAEEESPIGIISALNLARYHDSACMKEVQQFLENKSSERPEAKQLKRFWTKAAKEVGLLVSERLINIPMDLVPPLYAGLFEEILWATDDEPTEELRNSFKFKHYLVLTKVFEELPKKSQNSEKNGQRKQLENGNASGDLIFIKPEDEILLKLSSWSFTFPVKLEASASHETKNTRQLQLVMGLNAEQIPVFMTELKDLVQ